MVVGKNIYICRGLKNDHSYGIFYGENPFSFSFPIFMLEIAFFVILYRLIRYFLKPLRQPKVVSQIISGIIIGPTGLSRSKKFKAYMFPETSTYAMQNVAVLGFMYFLFVNGVKVNFLAFRKADRRCWYVAVIGIIVPLFCSIAVAFMLRKSLNKELMTISSIWGVTSSLAITGFPVLYPIMNELNLLSSELGKIALPTALVGDMLGINGIIVFEAAKQGEHRPMAALYYIISLNVVLILIFVGLRLFMMWIVRTTPVGKPVDQIYVIGILLGVMVMGFIADMFGLAIANGALWFGLAVPEGPPLGSILVEKCETILSELFLPCTFMYMGMVTDISLMSSQWSQVQPFFLMILVGYTMKLVSSVAAARFVDLTTRDSFTLGLIMCLRGEVEFLLGMHWMEFGMIGQSQLGVLVLSSTITTAIATPIISILHDPTRPYMVNKRRNIQHAPVNIELHIVACIDDEENLYGLLKLLELSNPTIDSPFSVHALCLIELEGCAKPEFIDHENEEEGAKQYKFSSVHNALRIFQESRGEYIKLHSYTAIAHKRSMYQDICELALSKQACLIILPLHKRVCESLNSTKDTKQGPQSISSNVLAHAPCSVGILVDKSPYQSLVTGVLRTSMHHFVVLFLGGPDSREALSYADRAAGSPDISLTVIRFLSCGNEGDILLEKKLDDQVVTWFWVKNEGNERVVYREAVVKNGEETIAIIQSLNKDCYDLWIVGRNQSVNNVLLQGLTNWSENTELGVIGEYIASDDFSSRGSVLVVQQQVLRGQRRY